MQYAFQYPKYNTIKQELDIETTHQINSILSTHKTLVIIEETSTHKYTQDSLLKPSIYKIISMGYLKGGSHIIPITKFSVLARQGIIRKENYDFVIFRLKSNSKILTETFKIFYYRNLRIDDKIPIIVCYFSIVTSEDPIYLHSRAENFISNSPLKIRRDSKRGEVGQNEVYAKNLVNIFVSHIDCNEYNEYMEYKRYLTKMIEGSDVAQYKKYVALRNKTISLEGITYKYALINLKEHIKAEFERTGEFENEPILTINDYKFKKTTKIIAQNLSSKIYVATKRPQIIQYLKAENEKFDNVFLFEKENKISSNSILIIYDLIDLAKINNDLKKIYVFYHGNDYKNLNLVNAIRDLKKDNAYVNTEKAKALNYMKSEKGDIYIEKTGACINVESSLYMLQNFICLLQNMYKDECLYIKNMQFDQECIEKEGMFVCTLTFPIFYEGIIKFVGDCRTTKSDAKKSAAFKMCKYLYNKKLMDDHLCPIKEEFIDKNKIYYQLCIKTYNLEIVKIDKTGSDTLSKNTEYFFRAKKDSHQNNLENAGMPDDSFFLFVETFGLKNDQMKSKISEMKENYYEEKVINYNLNPSKIKSMFEKDYGVFLEKEILIYQTDKVIKFERKQADCFKKYDKKFYVYIFNKKENKNTEKNEKNICNLGICTGQSFQEKLMCRNISIEFVEIIDLNEEEQKSIIFFQVILFILHFKKIKNNVNNYRPYCYFFVPIKNRKVDIDYLKKFSSSEFLVDNVYNCTDMSLISEQLLYNPFTKKFYTYAGPSSKKITDIESFGKKQTSFFEYYEEKYNTKLLKKDEDGLLFSGYLFDGKVGNIVNILSSEILQVTSIKKEFSDNFNKSKEYVHIFETAALAYEMKNKMNLEITTQIAIQCLTTKEDDKETNYERLEFLGDSVLKFVSSKYIFLTKSEALGDAVTRKDSLISNEALFQISKNLKITEYFSFTKYSDGMFQPPNILEFIKNIENDSVKENCDSYISYFEANNIFLSNNVGNQYNKNNHDDDKVKGLKTYADILEALIGAHFVELGFEKSENFIHETGITKINENDDIKIEEKDIEIVTCDFDKKLKIYESSEEYDSIIFENKEKMKGEKMKILTFNYDNNIVKEMKKYKNILPYEAIRAIEGILNYEFIFPGLIEKAMIHPSSHRNILGSVHFNKLELLGDCALDLVITEYIYNNTDFDPEGLHFKRKSLVNNFSLARVLFKLKLTNFLHIGFDQSHMRKVMEKLNFDGETVNKAFGDVFESICGAVLVDVGFCYKKFKKFVLENLLGILIECADETR